MKVLIVDKILYFFLAISPIPSFFLLTFYSFGRIENYSTEKTWVDYLMIFVMPLLITSIIIRVRMWLFFRYAKILRDQIKRSGLLIKEVFDNSGGYSYRVKSSLEDEASEFDIFCDFNDCYLSAHPNVSGSKSHKIHFYFNNNLQSIILFIQKKEEYRRKKLVARWGKR
jgi:hypothetical protein